MFEYTEVWIKAGWDRRCARLPNCPRNLNTKDDLMFTVSSAPDSVSSERLAYMQGQRFWIERALEDAKGSLGMADYQLRKFRGWKHHMALTLLAHLFLQRERISNAQAFPLLSCQDVVTMLEFYLPKRDVTEEELFRQMAERHRKRQGGIDRIKTGS